MLPPEQHIRAAQEEMRSLGTDDLARVDRLMHGYLNEGISFVTADTVVILLHGIRDHAKWHENLQKLFKSSPNIAKTYSAQYKHFDIANLMLHRVTRDDLTKNIESQIDHVLQLHRSQRVYLIAHSYGTFLISHLFLKGKINSVYGVVFCGSIVPASFNWSGLSAPLRAPVINDCGVKDHLPLVANTFFFDFGTAGRFGFYDNAGAINRYHECGHGGFFNDDFVKKFWLPYIERGRVEPSEVSKPEPGWWMTLVGHKRFILVGYALVVGLLSLVVTSVYHLWQLLS